MTPDLIVFDPGAVAQLVRASRRARLHQGDLPRKRCLASDLPDQNQGEILVSARTCRSIFNLNKKILNLSRVKVA